MNIQSSTGNVFRSSAHVGVRQKIARRRALDLPGGILLWKAVGKVLIWAVPVVLAANLWCAHAIDTSSARSLALQQELVQLEDSADELALQRQRLTSPVRVKIAAAEKLSLYEPSAGQIRRM
ncbi:MAG TPA: hypothetical protein VJ969_11015 [Desulfopila sp.]|nr:hypothetical protein [Desulfopila sp.]